MPLKLRITLKSDALFGKGEEVAGLVDSEVEHDELGIPFLRGRVIKGLWVEECANILFALEKQDLTLREKVNNIARYLYGVPGSGLNTIGNLRVGDATLPEELRATVYRSVYNPVRKSRLDPADVLDSLTDIRRQTAIDFKRGAPKEGALRSMRVILRNLIFTADLDYIPPEGETFSCEDAVAFLTACVLAVKRAGTGRNRGFGKLTASILSPDEKTDLTKQYFHHFTSMLRGESK
jgi:hypothetical protein